MGRTSGRSLRPRRNGDENSNDGSSSSTGSACGKKRKSELDVTPRSKKRRAPQVVEHVGRKTRKSRLETPPSTPKPTPKSKKKKPKKNNRFEVEDDPPGDPDYESPEEEPPWMQEDDGAEEGEADQSMELDSDQEDQVNEADYDEDEEDDEQGNQMSQIEESNEHDMTEAEVWRDTTRSFPPLSLPDSSLDLLIPPSQCLADSIAVYEALRFFALPLKLTPFRLEDFAACLVAKEHNALLSSIFIALLRVLFKSDNENGIQYGPADMRDGGNLFTCFVDHMTWPHVLKTYAQADPEHFGEMDVAPIATLAYQPSATKIKVLMACLNAVLDSVEIRAFTEKLRKESSDEEFCRHCQTKGNLVLCDSCPAGYHAICAKLEEGTVEKMDSWECPVCVQNKVPTVTDAVLSIERDAPTFLRHKPLGHDRHGRSYWLIARRIFVLDTLNDAANVWYYSTTSQFESLLDVLDPGIYEMPLCKQFDDLRGEIMEQMQMTTQFPTALPNQNPTTALKYLEYVESGEDAASDEVKSNSPDCFETFTEMSSTLHMYRYGQECRYRKYKNFFSDNLKALNKKEIQTQKNNENTIYRYEVRYEADKRIERYIRPENTRRYLWPIDECQGSERQYLSIIAKAMVSAANDIKHWFFHPDWRGQFGKWKETSLACTTVDSLARQLEQFELHLRPCFKRASWHDSLGQSTLYRLLEDKKDTDARKTREKVRKQTEARAEEDRINYMATLYNPEYYYTRNRTPNVYMRMQNLSKLKGEEYRFNRSHTGWQWHSTCYQSRLLDKKMEKKVATKKLDILNGLLERRKAVVVEKTEMKDEMKNDMDDIFDSVLNTAAEQSERNQEEIKKNGELADTAKVFRICCTERKPRVIKAPQVKRFSSNGKSNIFRQSFGVKKMARQAGQRANARGFNYTSKSVRQKEVWPYPGPKASFHVMWKYKLSLCDGPAQLALLFSGFVRLLKWDLVTEVPNYIQGDKLSWTANSFNDEEQIKQYEIKNKRFIPGSARLRCEYEMNIKDVQNETNEIIPRRDQRAVEAIERSGRTLRRTIKPIEEVVQRDQDICMWITEEKMEVWQIDLYHRNTEDGGVHIQRNNSAIGSKPGERFNLRDREKIRPPRPADDYSPDYTPDRDLMPTPSRRVQRHYNNSPLSGQNGDQQQNQPELQRTDRNSIMMPRNRPPQGLRTPVSRPIQYVRDSMGNRVRQVDSPSSYTPYRPQNTPPPQRRPGTGGGGGGGASATNVRITKAILDSILLNPEHFTQISHDKPPHLCTFLKLANPDDARQFKGGKNYQTTIQGRVKQIFSYIPQDPAMYQFMLQRELVLRPAPTTNTQQQQQQQPPRQQSVPTNGNNNHPVDDKQHVKSLVDNLVEKVANETENSYITGQARIGLAAREKLEAKKKNVRDNIYQERVKLVQGYAKKLAQQKAQLNDATNSPGQASQPQPPQQQQQQQQLPKIFSPSTSSSIRSPLSLSSCSSPGSPSVTPTGQKFCVCKAHLTPTQHGDVQCDLCRNTFHSMCVGVAANVPYTCEPCKQKHNSARSSCLCGKCDDDIKQNWISCDVCQTWYHQKCVGIDERAEQQEYICPKCGANDLAILCRTLQTADYKLLVSSFSKLRSSKYAWPFNQSSQIPVSMNRIIQKIGLNSYTTFKEFMDEMIDMFQRFRDHFDQNGSHSSKEYKCCEIVEYDFSNAVREFITKGQKQIQRNYH